MNRNYSETSMISIPADKNNKAIILDVGGKKHKIRGEIIENIIKYKQDISYISNTIYLTLLPLSYLFNLSELSKSNL